MTSWNLTLYALYILGYLFQDLDVLKQSTLQSSD